MISPNSLIPANEPARLRTLHHYQVLNTTPEDLFDEFVALAAQLFNLPISLISLVDEEQVFFKANVGLPGLERVDRADSLCSAAILQDNVMVYNDLSQKQCDLVNPYVAQSAGLRFYAGAALRMADGSNIGSLCVIGREARAITAEEEQLLMLLAGLVCRTVELRHCYLQAGRASDWQTAQSALQEMLRDNAALARYLTNRTGTVSASDPDRLAVQRRFDQLHWAFDGYMAEFAATAQQLGAAAT